MGEETRPAGIDIIGNVPWGTHFCQFYQTKEDLLDILVPYFKAGLENNEFCMWITAEPLNEREAEEALRKAVPDFDRYLKRGQIEILPHNKWYLKDGAFNSDRVLNGWVDKLNQALAKGYDGLRLTGNTFWLEKRDRKSFTDYEAAINNVIGNYRMIAICSYCVDRCDASELIDVVVNHQFSVIRREGDWKIIESSERRCMEEELQRLGEQYQIMLRTLMDGFWIVDSQGRFLEVNDTYCCLTGYSRQELLSMSIPDVEASERQEETARHIQSVIQNGADRFETRHRCKDGRIVRLEVSVSYSSSNGGRMYVFFQDITERKQAEEEVRDALEESWQRQKEIGALLKGSRAILEYGKFNDAARAIFGFCKNIIGAIGGYVALLSPDGAENELLFLDSGGLLCTVDPSLPMPIRGLRGESYRTGKAVYHNDFAQSEWLNFLPTGHVTIDNVLFAPLMIEGKALGLLGLANKPGGFTENDAHLASGFGELAAISLLNSRIWESLQHSEASYRTLVEASPDGVLALDADGQIIDCNEGLCQLLGYEKVKVKGNDIRKFLPAAMPAELTAQLRHKGRLEAEFEAVRQDGQTVTVWAKGVARVDEEGKLSQTVLYIRDIAERKKLDELKDELIGLVSHEIRTPLTVIMGGLNTLLSEETRLSPEEKRQLLQDAALETNSLSYLLGDLIELSRAQANRLSLNLEPVAIRSVIKGVVGKLEQQTSAHRFVIDLPPRLPMVQADPIRIERILHNLLENAVKYSPRGGEIRVLAKRDGNHLVIGVRDQGVGISQADQTKLFIPFERLENRGLEEVKGAGLGLMVCRRLVEAHGGRIWVESQPSRGSTFFFTLPFSKAGT